MKTVRDFDVESKKVLVRCDFNVPLDERGNIVDDFRIQESLPTIRYLREKGAHVILIAHLGRPSEGERFSLQVVAERLEKLLGEKVSFVKDLPGSEQGDITLLENIRFHKGEKENNLDFAKELAFHKDIYINDAFGTSHRTHASIVGISQFLPSGAGLLLEKEIGALQKIIKNPKKPLIVIVGGTKVATKADFLDEMSKIADTILLGNPVFKEISETGFTFRGSEKIVGPIDGVPDKQNALDIGERTVALFQEKLKKAKTIFWTGPLGKIEEEEYTKGSLAIAQAIIASGADSIAGGGDLSRFLHDHGLLEKFSHVSTGGGAMLAFLSGKKLPGLQALGYYNGNQES